MPPPNNQIIVYDDNRLLPADPNQWPESLKQDIRNCCCGSSSSSSSTTAPPKFGVFCCNSGSLNYTGFTLTVTGGSRYDGTFPLTYQTGQYHTRKPGLGCAEVATYVNGWFSDWNVSPCPNIFNDWRFFLEETLTGVASCGLRMIFRGAGDSFFCPGFLEYTNDNLSTVWITDTVSCTPLVLTYNSRFDVLDCNLVTSHAATAIITES